MNPPAQTGAPPSAKRPKKGNGVTTPSRRGGSGRVLTDVLVELGFVSRGEMDEAIERANGNGSAPERLLLADGDDHRGPARARGRRALRPRPPRPLRLPRRPRRGQARHPGRGQALPGVPVSFAGDRTLLVAMADPANVLAVDDIAVMTGYEVRPAVASAADIEQLLERLEDPDFGNGAVAPDLEDDEGDSDVVKQRPAHGAVRPAVRPHAERADRLRRRRGGRVGHPARAPGDQGGRRARRLRHPLRARRRRDARPLPHRRRAPGGRHGAQQRRPGRHLAREDHGRPRHRRAPHPAGRPHLARGRRQADRPARRHAPVRLRRERRHAHPRPVEGHDRARAARHAPAGARALHQGLQPGARRGARHRPDRLRQVDVALRRAQPAQHDREEHHHDRGPGRVPARRHHPGPGQQQGRPDLRQRPALDDARRPRHHHGRRDPRPRDGADRRRGRAHRPPRALHAAHQRRAGRRHAPDRDGHRALPRRLRRRLRRRPAPRAPAVRGVQAPHHDHRRRDAHQRLQRRPRPRGLRARRLRALRRLGLQGPDRPLRGHVGLRHDPRAGRRPRARRDDRPRGGPRGHDAAARGRAREGPPRSHDRSPRSLASPARARVADPPSGLGPRCRCRGR